MLLFNSPKQISTKLILAVLLTLLVISSTFAAIIFWRLHTAANQQQQAIETLGLEQISNELTIEATLFSELLKQLVFQVDYSLAAFRQNNELTTAIRQKNSVAINDIFARFVKTGEVDSIIAVDKNLQTIARHSQKLILANTDEIIAKTIFAKELKNIIAENNIQQPKSYTGYFVGNEKYKNAIGINKSAGGGLFIVSIHPLFNEAGEVISLLIANRHINENSLMFRDHAKLQLTIIFNSQVILQIGTDIGKSGEHLISCEPFAKQMQICLAVRAAQIKDLTANIMQVITVEKLATMKYLLLAYIFATIIATISIMMITNIWLRPLASIKQTLLSLAKGNWRTNIKAGNSEDEIGEIIKAMLLLQESVKENELKQIAIGEIDKLNRQKEIFATIIEKCRLQVRQSLFILEDKCEIANTSSEKLLATVNLASSEIASLYIIFQNIKKLQDIKSLYETLHRLQEIMEKLQQQSQILKSDLMASENEIRQFSQAMKKSLNSSHRVTKN